MTHESLESYQASFDGEPGYLDWAAFGPPSPSVRTESVADIELLGSGRPSSLGLVRERVNEAQQLVAELIGGRTDQVVLQPSTTAGLQHAFYGLSGEILMERREFPSLTVTAMRAAATTGRLRPRWLETPDGVLTADAARDALTPDIAAVAVSLVDYRTGARVDLSALRDAIGPDRLLIVDAVQGFGVVEADYASADVVCANGYKWLRAGRGTGFSWFADRAAERIDPVLSGFAGLVDHIYDDPDAPAASGAAAYAVSPPDALAAGRLAVALEAVRDAGVADIEAELADRVRDVMFFADRYDIPVLTPREPERRAGIVALAPAAADVAPLAASLVNHGLAFTTRGGILRIAPHVGTDAATLRLFGDALAAFSHARTI